MAEEEAPDVASLSLSPHVLVEATPEEPLPDLSLPAAPTPLSRVLETFGSVFVSDDGLRGAALDELESSLHALVDATGDAESARLFAPMLFRLATRCPLEDVRAVTADVYMWLVDEGLEPLPPPPPPSVFLDADTLVPIDAPIEALQQQFHLYGFVDNATQILAWHPSFLELFVRTEAFLWRDGGSLPIAWRWYIGIMAAAQLRNGPLLQRVREEFLRVGGEARWLRRGLSAVPAKLAALSELNALLAHQPWLVQPRHVAELLHGDWSVAELAHAMMLMTSTHALASLYAGVGVSALDDVLGDESLLLPAGASPRPLESPQAFDGVDEQEEGRLLQQLLCGGVGGGEGLGEVEVLFEDAGTQDGVMTPLCSPTAGAGGAEGEFARFVGEHGDLRYENYDVRSTKYRVVHTANYSWASHAFALADRVVPGVARLLDEEFTLTYELTYHTYSDAEGVDTLPFRRAVWYYVMRLYGFCNDDYQYGEINVVLMKPVKAYVRLVACLPESVTAAAFNSFSARLTPEERVHVNLLVMEARKQVGLLYALRALSSSSSST